jgi:hypothetical protein
MFRRIHRSIPVLAASFAAGARLCAFAAEPEGIEFFEKEIRPILVEHCLECHAGDTEQKGGLVLDSRQGWTTGGDSGPAIVPGDPEGSLLVEAVRYENPNFEMPPKSRLPADKIARLEKWVRMGAPDPREGVVKKAGAGLSVDEGRSFWSYRKPVEPPVPDAGEAPRDLPPIDRFLRVRMKEAGVASAPPASPEARLRRLHFDLTGLPPDPEEIRAFAADPSPAAWEREVDRLLASPHFGERWGRHWLDVVRYGESFTLRGLILREAWRYRDHVIAAFNEDRPYDRTNNSAVLSPPDSSRWETTISRNRTSASSISTSSTSSSTRSARPFSGKPWAVPAAMTTSSIRFRPATITPSRASSRTPKSFPIRTSRTGSTCPCRFLPRRKPPSPPTRRSSPPSNRS